MAGQLVTGADRPARAVRAFTSDRRAPSGRSATSPLGGPLRRLAVPLAMILALSCSDSAERTVSTTTPVVSPLARGEGFFELDGVVTDARRTDSTPDDSAQRVGFLIVKVERIAWSRIRCPAGPREGDETTVGWGDHSTFGATGFEPAELDDTGAFPGNLVDQRVAVTGVGLDPTVAFEHPDPEKGEGCETTFATEVEVPRE